MCNFSTAHTMARASFSVCEYRRSTGLSVRLAYATTRLSSKSGVFCTSIADNPVGEASVMSSVSLLGSKYAITLALVRSSLICWKDSLAAQPNEIACLSLSILSVVQTHR